MTTNSVAIVRPEELDEAKERELVGARQGHGLLVAYPSHDPLAEPWVLVHGIHDAPLTLRPLADRIAASPGAKRQVYFFFYDDADRSLDRTGDDLARALVELSGGSPRRVRVVAHSMGGIVARAAMNSLVEPRWMPTESLRDKSPHEPQAHLFSRLDVITLDTPWHGFTDVDIVASSAMLGALTQVDLPAHFSLHQIDADDEDSGAPQDNVAGFAELDEEAFGALVQCFVGESDVLSKHRRLSHLVDAIRDEADGPKLFEQLTADANNGGLTREGFLELTGSATSRIPGTHTSMLVHEDLLPEIERTFARYD